MKLAGLNLLRPNQQYEALKWLTIENKERKNEAPDLQQVLGFRACQVRRFLCLRDNSCLQNSLRDMVELSGEANQPRALRLKELSRQQAAVASDVPVAFSVPAANRGRSGRQEAGAKLSVSACQEIQ